MDSMAGRSPELRVVKLGGSLLEIPDLKRRISDWLMVQSKMSSVWLVGGGEKVEAIRQRDLIENLDPVQVHWDCIRQMDHNSQRIGQMFPNWRTESQLDIHSLVRPTSRLSQRRFPMPSGGRTNDSRFCDGQDSTPFPLPKTEVRRRNTSQPANIVLAPTHWIREHASQLPASWDVTSDSIAASLAIWLSATELVLLKSADAPQGGIQAVLESQYVDRYFAQALGPADAFHAGMRVRAVNFRSNEFNESNWPLSSIGNRCL